MRDLSKELKIDLEQGRVNEEYERKEVFRASISKGKNLKKILNILVYLDIS